MPSASGAGPAGRLSAFLYRHPRLRLGGLLTPPLFWLVVAYLALAEAGKRWFHARWGGTSQRVAH